MRGGNCTYCNTELLKPLNWSYKIALVTFDKVVTCSHLAPDLSSVEDCAETNYQNEVINKWEGFNARFHISRFLNILDEIS